MGEGICPTDGGIVGTTTPEDIVCHFCYCSGSLRLQESFAACTDIGELHMNICEQLGENPNTTRLVRMGSHAEIAQSVCGEDFITNHCRGCLSELRQLGSLDSLHFTVVAGQEEIRSEAGSTGAVYMDA